MPHRLTNAKRLTLPGATLPALVTRRVVDTRGGGGGRVRARLTVAVEGCLPPRAAAVCDDRRPGGGRRRERRRGARVVPSPRAVTAGVAGSGMNKCEKQRGRRRGYSGARQGGRREAATGVDRGERAPRPRQRRHRGTDDHDNVATASARQKRRGCATGSRGGFAIRGQVHS